MYGGSKYALSPLAVLQSEVFTRWCCEQGTVWRTLVGCHTYWKGGQVTTVREGRQWWKERSRGECGKNNRAGGFGAAVSDSTCTLRFNIHSLSLITPPLSLFLSLSVAPSDSPFFSLFSSPFSLIFSSFLSLRPSLHPCLPPCLVLWLTVINYCLCSAFSVTYLA